MANVVASVGKPHVLRVAAVWGTTVVAMKTLSRGQSFTLGDDAASAIPIPDGLEMATTPLRAGQGGWELDAKGAVRGMLLLRGRHEDPVMIARTGAPVQVMPGDYGLVQYGLFSIFFQYTTPADVMTGSFGLELLTVLAIFSSGVLHVGMLGFMRTVMTPPPINKPLELTSPEEYAARFGLHRAAIEETPPPVTGDSADPGLKEPGARDTKKQGGGEKIAGPEGKLGLKGTAKITEIPGEIKPTTSYGGMSDVLNSETGDEIRHTLKTIDTVASALSGLNSTNVTLGVGPGAALRGGGAGGGGNRTGVAFGSGTLNTGWGPGASGGYGTGNGGAGAAGNGGTGRSGAGGGGGTGSATAGGERTVAVAAGAPAAKGGLSPEQVRRVVMAHTGALRACYEGEAQRNPSLRGGVTVQWQIDPGGGVSTASLAGTTLGNQRVEGCVLRQVKTWRFPASESPTTVASYPFKFGVGS